jgi:hypothetical protein
MLDLIVVVVTLVWFVAFIYFTVGSASRIAKERRDDEFDAGVHPGGHCHACRPCLPGDRATCSRKILTLSSSIQVR